MNGPLVSPASASLRRIVGGFVLFLCCGVTVVALLAWLIPIEAVQGWAVNRAPDDRFSQWEAFHASRAATWVVRWASTTFAVLLAGAWMKRRLAVPFLTLAVAEFWSVASPEGVPMTSASVGARIWTRARLWIPRLLIVGWLVLAEWQFMISIQRRIWDWPVYGLQAGKAVLPNISDANIDVIRYLEEATPPGSRILIFSDQKLFFLSYYLLPRRLFHPVHPDSEFVIPKPFNQLQLAAYRREDIDPERIRRLRPDFILDYFEGAKYLEGQDLNRDAAWQAFGQRRHGPGWRPQFLVSLRGYSEGDAK